MTNSKKKAFTLIELIAVLVIMAIIALIATPLVMNIIRKARISADKRSVDAYGRSIELAIAGYLMDTGSFPTSIEQLTIEYSGDEVVCTTTNLNSDSSIYLAGCTVGGRSVEGYTYGKEETTPEPVIPSYSVGDHVSYNGVTYYVIEDSDTTNDTVTLLKENPLTVKEINDLSVGDISVDGENNDYGSVPYGTQNDDYSSSVIKKIVDAWKISINSEDIINARLITFDEIQKLGYGEEPNECCGGLLTYPVTEAVPNWLYNNNYSYYSMTKYNLYYIWCLYDNGNLGFNSPGSALKVRPVLEINKSADITKLD